MKTLLATVALAGLAFTLPAAAFTVARPQANMTLIHEAGPCGSRSYCEQKCAREVPANVSACIARKCSGCKRG